MAHVIVKIEANHGGSIGAHAYRSLTGDDGVVIVSTFVGLPIKIRLTLEEAARFADGIRECVEVCRR